MQRLVFFDLDGTLIDNPSSEKLYLLWLIANGHIKIKQIVQTLKFFTKWLNKFKTEIFVKNKAYLFDLPVEETIKKAQQFTSKKLLPRLRPNIVQLLKQHQNKGDIIILLTGAPKFIADVFAKQLEVSDVRAAEFSCTNKRFNSLPPLQHPFAKEKLLLTQKVCGEYGFDIRNSVAYANSIHDLALLEKVGRPVVVTPDYKLRKIALQKKWEIIEK